MKAFLIIFFLWGTSFKQTVQAQIYAEFLGKSKKEVLSKLRPKFTDVYDKPHRRGEGYLNFERTTGKFASCQFFFSKDDVCYEVVNQEHSEQFPTLLKFLVENYVSLGKGKFTDKKRKIRIIMESSSGYIVTTSQLVPEGRMP